MDRDLFEFERNFIVILRNCGKSWTEIAQELRAKYYKMVIKRGMEYLWKNYLEKGSVVDKIRSSWPPIISLRCSRAIEQIYQRNRILSVSSITSIYNTILYDMNLLVRCRKFLKSTNWGAIQHTRSLYWQIINVVGN